MKQSIPSTTTPLEARVFDHVPMAHVASVDTSLEFYVKLGFVCESRFTDARQEAYFASICADAAELMLVRADGLIVAAQQAVLFYMYTASVLSLRKYLLASGLRDGGVYADRPNKGEEKEAPNPCTVYSVTQPFYMTDGEIRIHDPDGYVILVGQLPDRKPYKRKLKNEL